IFQDPAPREVMALGPWLDVNFFGPIEEALATLEAQTHRRQIKTHLPFDSLPLFSGVKYIHVARDGRDACMSMQNHELGFLAGRGERPDNMPEDEWRTLTAIPEDPRDYFLRTLSSIENGRSPAGDVMFPEFEMTYWRERGLKNLLLVHYNDLKADLA